MRAKLEICHYLRPRELLQSVSTLSKLWRAAACSDEVWTQQYSLYFPLPALRPTVGSVLQQYKDRVGTVYLPVVCNERCYQYYLSGRVEVLKVDIGKDAWWTGSSFPTITVLCSRDMLVHLPETSSFVLLDPISCSPRTPIPDMLESRMLPSLCPFPLSVYVFGGSECDVGFFNPMPTCEKLSLQTMSWSRLPDMKYPRGGTHPATYIDRIYLAGPGCIEVFDTRTDLFVDCISVSGLEEADGLYWYGSLIYAGIDGILVVSGLQGSVTTKEIPVYGCSMKQLSLWTAFDSIFACCMTYRPKRGFQVYRLTISDRGLEGELRHPKESTLESKG